MDEARSGWGADLAFAIGLATRVRRKQQEEANDDAMPLVLASPAGACARVQPSRRSPADMARDSRAVADLQTLGWRVFIGWECEAEARLDVLMEALRALRLRRPA